MTAITHGHVYTLPAANGSRSAWIAIVAEDGRIGLVADPGRLHREGMSGADWIFRDGALWAPFGSAPAVFSDGKLRTLADLEDAGFDALTSGKRFRELQRKLDE